MFHSFKLLLLIGLAVLAETKSSSDANDKDFQYSSVLDHNDRVRLEWNVYKSARRILFKLILINLKFPSFVGFGASDHGKFENADFLVFELKWKNASVSYLDCYTNGQGILKADSNNKTNYSFISIKVNFIKFSNNYLKINIKTSILKILREKLELQFSRKFDTCDPNDYRIEPGTVHLLHFIETDYDKYKSLRNLTSDGVNYKPGLNANSSDMKQSQLIKSTYFDNSIAYFNEVKHKTFEVVNTGVNIPAQETTYWCRVFKLADEFHHKHHIIAYESVISEASRGVAHHMELFHCLYDPTPQTINYNGPCK